MSTSAQPSALIPNGSLLAENPQAGMRLAIDLAGRLAAHVGDASGAPSQMADYLRTDRLPAGTRTLLTLMQFSIIAAANDYWRNPVNT